MASFPGENRLSAATEACMWCGALMLSHRKGGASKILTRVQARSGCWGCTSAWRLQGFGGLGVTEATNSVCHPAVTLPEPRVGSERFSNRVQVPLQAPLNQKGHAP